MTTRRVVTPSLTFLFVAAMLGSLSLVAQTEAPSSPAGLSSEPAASLERLREDIDWLCAPERKGRGQDKEAKVAGWIEERFKKLELLPLFGESFRQGVEVGGLIGWNVGGILPGSHWPDDKSHIVLSAHHDHLGIEGEAMYPGAADNAAGVASLLEMARSLRGNAATLRHSIVFLAFDLEEIGLLGSRAYVKSPAIPLESMIVFTTMDILGRGLLDLDGDRLAVLGWERSPALLDVVKPLEEESGLDLVFIGSDVVGDRSDYVPFRNHGVPFLFFSTGENVDYHKPTDVPERLNMPLLVKQVVFIEKAARGLGELDQRPVFDAEPALRVEEAASFAKILKEFERLPEAMLPAVIRRQVTDVRLQADAIVAKGELTRADRARITGLAKMLMMMGRVLR